ncbi:WD40-repeat-containing domain protein [Nemania sp. NC0429]|nr:WD40-repeat-containing domain protein [Nemania sp. NC0429]
MFRRKFRRTDPNLPDNGTSSDHTSTTSSKSRFSLTKTLSKTPSAVDDGLHDPKGPLGLTLLHSPSDPQIDFIFVHGLGGGSRKTWSKSALLSHYWPREWLPKDPAFKNVRIHSYGYDSDYLKGKEDCLNIHHIGKSFLGEMSTSPYLVSSSRHIVAIGHSMGGLVIKKAYILAVQDSAYKALASRFVAIYFLATPHRGADSAKLLKNILRVAYDRAYVADLGRNSGAIQVINDEFRHFSANLELWSFYETQNMKLFSSPIVDPESAILGYREEKQMPMNADHRSICKFETQFDANYIILRNALASTVSNISTAVLEPDPKEKLDQIREIRKYLGVSEVFDDDYLTVKEARILESCHWISTKDAYIKWRDGDPGSDRLFWVKGKPATGKSVLAGYVIDHLLASGHDCCYFFFKHGDRSKSGLGACLRSLAFQMAISNTEARDAILEMQTDGVRLEHTDDRTLWRVLFLSGILRATTAHHYWVIDALDECSNASVLFNAMIPKIDESVPLRILITSRDTVDLEQRFSGLHHGLLQSLSISTSDTLPDLMLLIKNKIEALSVVATDDRVLLKEKILGKCKGSFLWTILVLKELQNCHSTKEINRVLEDVPRGMEPMYKRTLDLMSQSPHGKQLSKTILAWATCSLRPMTIRELNGALNLDIEDVFPNLEESIVALCGQLVVVDKFGKIQMVHETAREFLFTNNLDSEFAIEKRTAHTRMAQVCLRYLVGEEMKPPRTNRRRAASSTPTERADFAVYAYTAFSFHLSKADPLALDLRQLVDQFLKANVLTWIEAMANSQNLHQLLRTSKHLRIYLDACAVERSPLDSRARALRQWIADFPRIVAKFANALITCPSAIYSLIPPFCPTNSVIYNARSHGRRLTVAGPSSENWDDRLSCVNFRAGRPTAVCYGDDFLAVGLSNGSATLYHATSCQEYKVLSHGEAIRFIKFKSKTNLMATCGMRMTKVWDIKSGEVLHSFTSPQRPVDIEFDGEVLLVASEKNYLARWDLESNAAAKQEKPWGDSPEPSSTPLRRAPCAVAVSISHKMIAIAYSERPIALWDMEEDAYFGSCGKKLSSGETSTHIVVALAFNPNPNIGLLAVAYLDGDLALLDPFSDQQVECFRANCQTLAASPNGRLLAAGGADGIIHIYEFDTFKLIYRVRSSNSYIKQLSFTKDSLRIADIRGAQCTVWEPATLLRESLSDGSSGTTSASIVDTVFLEAKSRISAMLVHPPLEAIFCGRDDGAVILYCRKTAVSLCTLYSHDSPVRLLAWCQQRNTLLSVDAANRIFSYSIEKSPNQGWLVALVFQSQLKSEKAIVDILVGEAAGKFVVSTRESDHLFSMDGTHEEERTYQGMPRIRKWFSHPRLSGHMVCADNFQAYIYSWTDWSKVEPFSLSVDCHSAQLKSLTPYSLGQEQGILIELSEREGSAETSGLVMVDADSFPACDLNDSARPEELEKSQIVQPSGLEKDKDPMRSPSSLALSVGSAALAKRIAHVIGIADSGKLVFLDRSSWVCSCDLGEAALRAGHNTEPSTSEYSRHFFVPYDWFAGSRDIIGAIAQRDVVFARGCDVMIIKGGFEHSERVGVV